MQVVLNWSVVREEVAVCEHENCANLALLWSVGRQSE